MKKNLKDFMFQFETSYQNILIFFLMSQVFIDLSATVSVNYLSIGINLAMLVRTFFLTYAFFYTICFSNRKTKFILLVLVLYYFFHTFIISILYNQSFLSNIGYLSKSLYFPIISLFFYALIIQRKESTEFYALGKSLDLMDLNSMNAIVYTLVISLSSYFHLGFENYPVTDGRLGTSGFFLSGNELGPYFLMMGLISLYGFKTRKKNIHLLASVLVFFSVTFLGTKTSILVSITLMIYFLYVLFINKERISLIIPFLIIYILFLLHSAPITNYMLQSQRNNEHLYYENLKSDDPIREEDLQTHKELEIIMNGDALYSVNINIYEERTTVSGYFYPKYADLVHPSLIEMELFFLGNNNEFRIPLINTYNRYLTHDGDQRYKTFFSGIIADSSQLSENELIDKEFLDIYMNIRYNGDIYAYRLNSYGVNIASNKYTVNQNYYSFKLGELKNENDVLPEITDNVKNSSSLILLNLLSGRNIRLSNFFNSIDYNVANFVFGTGPIGNLVNFSHFEMDIMEIFVTYGLFGLLLFILPFIILFKKFVFHTSDSLADKLAFIMSVGVVFIIGFFVGHTFIHPRVTFMIPFSIFVVLTYRKREKYYEEQT